MQPLVGGKFSVALAVMMALPVPAAADTDDVLVDGDVRVRSEAEAFEPGSERVRMRLRARAGVLWDTTGHLAVGAGVTTGSEAPTSSQLTLGDGFGRSPVKLATAYAVFRPVAWVDVWMGKVPYVFRHRRLVWDRDVTPEGATQQVRFGAPDARWSGHVTLGEYMLVEVRDSRDDVYALVAQAGAQLAWDGARVGVDVGGYAYPNATTHEIPYARDTNTRSADGLLAHDFAIAVALVDVAAGVRGVDVEAYVEAADNTGADGDSVALAAGAGAETAGLGVGYEYRRVERDAILDSLAESSWHADRTGFHGHKVRVAYRIDSNWRVASSAKWMRTLSEPSTRQVEWLVDLSWRK